MIPDKILNVFNRSIRMVCNNIACYCSDPASDLRVRENFQLKR